MKKLILLPFLILSINGFSQTWFDLGIKGGVGSSFLFDSNVNNDGRLGSTAGFNYFYGGKVGVNFGEFIGITCDVDYGSYKMGFTQSEVPGKPDTDVYSYKISYNSLNVSPYFRYTKESSYLEVGPNFSFMKNPFIEDEANPNASFDVENVVRKNLTGMTFGFGGHIIGNEVIALMMGLRFNYTFSNLTSDMYSETPFPFGNYSDIAASKSSPLAVQLVMEINYSLGYFVKASCGRRTAFLSF